LSWLILRTDFRKEHYVATQIRNMGLPAWVPCQMISTRLGIGRRKLSAPAVAIKELPILPRRLFVTGPGILDRELHSELRTLRHVEALEMGMDQRLVLIPDAQIAAFRAEIDRENTAALALMQARNSRKQKAKWKSLHDALVEMIQGAKNQMEQAA
jgi:hypothetical protein